MSKIEFLVPPCWPACTPVPPHLPHSRRWHIFPCRASEAKNLGVLFLTFPQPILLQTLLAPNQIPPPHLQGRHPVPDYVISHLDYCGSLWMASLTSPFAPWSLSSTQPPGRPFGSEFRSYSSLSPVAPISFRIESEALPQVRWMNE